MKHSLRNIARALVVGTIIALVLDLVMRVASSATLAAPAPTNPIDRAAAVIIAVLFYLTAAFWAERAADFAGDTVAAMHCPPRTAFVIVGLAMIAWAVLWALLTWAFASFSPDILGRILFAYVPSLLAGAALLAWSRHLAA